MTLEQDLARRDLTINAIARDAHGRNPGLGRIRLAGNTGVLATSNGKVVDIVTRIDLIQYWNQARQQQP